MKKQFVRYCSSAVKKPLLRQYPTALVNLNRVGAVRLSGYTDEDAKSIVFVSKEPWGENICVTFKTLDLAKRELMVVANIMQDSGMNISKYEGQSDNIQLPEIYKFG